ncbi:archaeal proteasome endopeptidase complex subunit alpha [Conexivisphaera calida]|nr:archaeal proteasome endopeptidase complex subunit alpha [Conexivisphaera calida]
MFAPSAGYDRALTIFSPDGRLYQVEYAIETVRRGTLAVGARAVDGVVLFAEERLRKLQDVSLSQKLFQVDDHVGAVAAGYVPDARVLIDNARVTAQNHRILYDEPITVETLAKRLGDLAQQYTQYAGVRPFGVSLVLAGVDRNGPSVFTTDPSGTYLGYSAIAIGGGSDQLNEYFEANYSESMSMDDAILMILRGASRTEEHKVLDPRSVKMAVIDVKTKRMRRLGIDEITSYLEKAKEQQ